MKTINIIRAGIAGTIAMSVFSYVISGIKNKDFKEPELLGKLIYRVTSANKAEAQLSGWILHFIAGISFAEIYVQLLKHSTIKPTVSNGLLIGGLSGIPAIFLWYTIFKLHPNPPKNKFKDYFTHLILAHIFFGAVTFASFSESDIPPLLTVS